MRREVACLPRVSSRGTSGGKPITQKECNSSKTSSTLPPSLERGFGKRVRFDRPKGSYDVPDSDGVKVGVRSNPSSAPDHFGRHAI